MKLIYLAMPRYTEGEEWTIEIDDINDTVKPIFYSKYYPEDLYADEDPITGTVFGSGNDNYLSFLLDLGAELEELDGALYFDVYMFKCEFFGIDKPRGTVREGKTYNVYNEEDAKLLEDADKRGKLRSLTKLRTNRPVNISRHLRKLVITRDNNIPGVNGCFDVSKCDNLIIDFSSDLSGEPLSIMGLNPRYQHVTFKVHHPSFLEQVIDKSTINSISVYEIDEETARVIKEFPNIDTLSVKREGDLSLLGVMEKVYKIKVHSRIMDQVNTKLFPSLQRMVVKNSVSKLPKDFSSIDPSVRRLIIKTKDRLKIKKLPNLITLGMDFRGNSYKRSMESIRKSIKEGNDNRDERDIEREDQIRGYIIRIPNSPARNIRGRLWGGYDSYVKFYASRITNA